MPNVDDISEFVQKSNEHCLNHDEYITYGSGNTELTGITVCWMAVPEAIEAAAKAGHNCLVHHESLTFPYPDFATGDLEQYFNWPINANRRQLLSKYGITAIRIHGSADEMCIYDAFAKQLGLGNPLDDDRSDIYCHKVFASPVATFGQLIEHVKRMTGMNAVRTTGNNIHRPVKRIGLPWGGLGLFVNVGYMQKIIDIGVDTFVCGETDNYGFRFAEEQGVAVIETSHEISETAGLRKFAELLQSALGVDVQYYDVRCVWDMR